jgi:hypothetical protein
MHFDIHHGYGNLDNAINLLNDDDAKNLECRLIIKSLLILKLCLLLKLTWQTDSLRHYFHGYLDVKKYLDSRITKGMI